MRQSERQTLAIQRDGRILLDTSVPESQTVEDRLRTFAELRSAAGQVHTYRVTDVSLWAAAASNVCEQEIIETLHLNASSRIPRDLEVRISRFFERYGHVRLTGSPGDLCLTCDDPLLMREIGRVLGRQSRNGVIPIEEEERGQVKAVLAQAGYPVQDTVLARISGTAVYELDRSVRLRDYQSRAVARFVDHATTGGLILLPCGAGKTVVGVAIAAELQARVLIVTPNRTIGEQWANHFVQMTSLGPADISLFDNADGERPVTILTYQGLTGSHNGISARLSNAGDVPWGLVIYDEVHTLPAEVFRQSAALQASRRLGLTATLVREDGREGEVYALVGPPVWQSRWRDLERDGWISPVECVEVRIRPEYDHVTEERGLASKIRTVHRLIHRHTNDHVLVAAHRIKEVYALARSIGAPAITGRTPQSERQRLYAAFRSGEIRTLVVSRVANVGVDLPDANVLIQVSGTFGSRLEEAQRLGRLLRPNKSSTGPARFYSLVLPMTKDRTFAERRQRFLVDQGYRYHVVNARA